MKLKPVILALAAASVGSAFGQSYTSTAATGLWNTSRWNNSIDAAPYTSAWVANSHASFTSGTYNFSGGNSSGAVNVGNITLASGVTVNFTAASGTIATSATRTIDVGSGALLDFNTQAMSTAAGTGFIKNGAGVLATAGGGYSGGFTLNAGTVIARGVDAMGANASNVLTLNGGVVASNATRSFANTKFGGGIVIGGNVQFGELATVVALASSSANLSFANNVSLGSVNRTFTQGNNGTNTFSAIISNTGSGGITFAANSGTDGRFEITNTGNTFTGDISITGGEVRFTADGSLGNAANDIIIDGGRLGIASGATVVLGVGRQIFVGDGGGSGISAPGATGILTYNGAIANKTGETGAWAKQGQGTLELGGSSTYTGSTAINNGIVKLTTGNDRLPTGTVVSLGQAASANLGTLDLNTRSQEIAGLTSTTGTNASASNNTITSATAATLTINTTGSNSYTYGDGTNANSGVIAGAISLVKSGDGTQILGDANTYTGTTTIDGGILAVNGSLASGSAVTVNSGGTLAGSGTIGGTVTVQGNGRHGAGTIGAVGTQTISDNLTYNSTSIFAWDVTNASTYDQVLGAAGKTLAGTGAVFNITSGTAYGDVFWDSHRNWTDIYSGFGTSSNWNSIFTSITGDSITWNSELGRGEVGTVGAGGTGGYFTLTSSSLNWTAVPEPSSALAGLLIAAGLLRRRRVA